MTFTQILTTALPIILALLAILKAWLERKGKKELALVLDAVIDGVEIAGDMTTKQAVHGRAKDTGALSKLDERLDAKKYRRNGGPTWKTGK